MRVNSWLDLFEAAQSETYLALEIDFLLKFGATNLSFNSPITPLR